MFILFKYIHYSTHLTMPERKFIIGEGAVFDVLAHDIYGRPSIMCLPLKVGSRLYRYTDDGNYEYTGTVSAIEYAAIAKFGHIGGDINIFIPHGSSPVDSRLEVGMVHSDALKVTVDFIDPEEQIFSILRVNVRLSKAMCV
jgi:hypothetical protein